MLKSIAYKIIGPVDLWGCTNVVGKPSGTRTQNDKTKVYDGLIA